MSVAGELQIGGEYLGCTGRAAAVVGAEEPTLVGGYIEQVMVRREHGWVASKVGVAPGSRWRRKPGREPAFLGFGHTRRVRA